MIKINVEKNNGNVEVELNISKEKWQKLLERAKKDLMSNLELKGFRKGKVPQNIAEKSISEGQIFNKAVDHALESHYNEAMEKIKDERIVSRPEVQVLKVTNEEAIIKIVSALFPEVKLGDYKNIKVEFVEPEVTDEEFKAEMKQTESLFEQVKIIEDKEHKVVNGDIVNIDFNGKLNGKEFDGGKAEGFDLEIGSKSFIEGFEDQIIGKKSGEKFVVKVTFPNEYPVDELKGKETEFDVKINHVSKKEKATGDELKEKLKQFKLGSMKELEERVKNLLTDRKQQEANDKFFREFVEAIKKSNNEEFKIPETLLKQEIDQEFKSFQDKLSQQGMVMKDYLKMLNMSEQEFKNNNLKKASENRIIDGLIYSFLIEDLGIKLEEKDFEKEFESIAKAQNMKVEEVKAQLNAEMLQNSLIFKKLIEEIKKF